MSKIMINSIKYGFAFAALALMIAMPVGAQANEKAGYYKPYSEEYTDTSYNPNPVVINTYSNNTSGYVMGASTKTVATKPAAPATDYKEIKEEFSDQTANALYGADSFFPSSLMGWLLFAIFVLIIIALVRKFTGKEEEYLSTPLKHS
jgi:hypothetical protein